MGEHTNQIAIRPEGAAADLADGAEISTARKPWTAPYMIHSTLADAETGGAGNNDGTALS